ncbi:MAG TPA: PrsW family intramembrane metalloprotease [Vicinamibacterales bacterium]|nr:PrsW family intramembrane metalloprotease [Vicinamibacterales bacterium]
MLLVIAAVPDRIGLLLSVTAASIPALIYATLVLRLDRYEVEPLRAVLACFTWGAVGAILFSVAAGLLFQFALEEALGAEAAAVASVVIGAPLVEESFKGIAVLAVLIFARDEIDSTLDGLVYGALVGVGFAMTENILYFGQAYLEGGLGEFGTLVFGRAILGGLSHPAYTAITGAAIGWSRGRYGRGIARVIVPILGWALAVALHIAWNGGLVLTSVQMDQDAGLLELVAVQTAIVIVPAVLVLYTIARMSRRHELAILREELAAEVERGTITQAEYEAIVDADERQRVLAAAQARGGRALRRRQQAFFHTAADLALRNHHRRQGEPSRPVHATRDDADRERLLALRRELAS